MTKSTFYPSTLTDEALTESLAAETCKSFDEIVAKMAASAKPAAEEDSKPKKRFITVLVHMPHVQKYGQIPTMSLTYGCTFAIEVGDKVLCPPTHLNSKWTTGVVTDLEDNGYRGPVKYVAPLGGRAKKKG